MVMEYPRIIVCRNRAKETTALVRVDPEDYEWLSQYTWSLATNGYARRKRRVGEDVAAGYPTMHRQIMGYPEGLDVDHINGDRLDNRRSNLRVVTRQENLTNRNHKRADGLPRGVTFDKCRGLWKAQVKLNQRNHFLGRFVTIEEAADAAAKFRAEHMPFSSDARAA
jgi:hypothetical protein